MAKIVHLNRHPQEAVIDALEFLLERAKAGEVTSFVLAAATDDGNVATSWAQADFGKRAELIAHLQLDLNFAFTQENIDRIIGQ
ncbi:hypothetical protein [Paenibacillus sinopodophylli]|uniref:hypothetical protein n=1 Tax=Paenibacillus sinopodophylli TaxID=1837342 RepID=UPI00110CDE14|nr:hypothetical protein [Paenibacillus sinopodophylli]